MARPNHRAYSRRWPTAVMSVALVTAGLATGCGSAASTDRRSSESSQTLIASIRTEPRSFNRFVARDATTDVIAHLTQASLVTIDRTTGALEPGLAESWRLLADGVTYELTLHDGLHFSDGHPFTAADVAFTFRALYDEHGGTALADTVRVADRPLVVRAVDDRTVLVTFPAPFGPGLRLLDGVPMLPRHRLEAALRTGRFAHAWGPATPPAEVVGLGPYALEMATSGQGLRFGRNRYYSGGVIGGPDHIVLKVVSDPETELALLESGELDLTPAELRPSDYGALVRRSGLAPVAVLPLGVALDGDLFWLNLTAKQAADPRSRWLQHPAFRTAIALAVDRPAFVDRVYLGAAEPACGLVSPGNREWASDPPVCRFDAAAARRQLASLGLADSDDDGTLEDGEAGPARFALLTQRGNVTLERGAAFIADSLLQLGVQVDVVPLDPAALVDRITSGNYDAAYFRLLTSDSDPALNADFWRSSGRAHVWNPGQQSPATDWERRVDALMNEVEASVDSARRHEAFRQVQAIVNRERPVEVFAFPRLWIATSHRVARVQPALFRPSVLWKPQAIEMRDAR